ncbi:hypothetical protein POUND7_002653 [Theobroma cacao]
MASLGIENLEKQRKKNERESLGDHGHSPHPENVQETVENWIQTSIAKGVEELDLNFSLANVLYKISSGFDDVKTMKTLKLCRCDLELLPPFQGLTSLRTPTLTKIKIAADSIKAVFSNFLSLETLELVQ